MTKSHLNQMLYFIIEFLETSKTQFRRTATAKRLCDLAISNLTFREVTDFSADDVAKFASRHEWEANAIDKLSIAVTFACML